MISCCKRRRALFRRDITVPLGTPVICERTERTHPHPAFEDCVLWLEGAQLEQFFAEDFATPQFYEVARGALARFEEFDPIEAYADLLAVDAVTAERILETAGIDPDVRPETLSPGPNAKSKGAIDPIVVPVSNVAPPSVEVKSITAENGPLVSP